MTHILNPEAIDALNSNANILGIMTAAVAQNPGLNRDQLEANLKSISGYAEFIHERAEHLLAEPSEIEKVLT